MEFGEIPDFGNVAAFSQPVLIPHAIFVMSSPSSLVDLLNLCPPPWINIEMRDGLDLPVRVQFGRPQNGPSVEEGKHSFVQFLPRRELKYRLECFVHFWIGPIVPELKLINEFSSDKSISI